MKIFRVASHFTISFWSVCEKISPACCFVYCSAGYYFACCSADCFSDYFVDCCFDYSFLSLLSCI